MEARAADLEDSRRIPQEWESAARASASSPPPRSVPGQVGVIISQRRVLLELPEELICECAQPECSKLITMTAVENDGLRAHSTWFAIAPGIAHFFPDVERIVALLGGRKA